MITRSRSSKFRNNIENGRAAASPAYQKEKADEKNLENCHCGGRCAGCGGGCDYGGVPSFLFSAKIAETKDLGSVHDGKNLRVGILGDTQLPGSEEEEQANKGVYKANLKAALELMKEQKVDLLIHVGDFCEVASDFGYQTYLSVFNEVYSDAASRPVTQYIMGNHDFWTEGSHGYPGYKQNLFEKNLEQSPWTHLILNGFHFIAASPDSGDSSRAYTGRALNWLDEQIALAEKDAEKDGKPIFVITHQNPSATVYGSGEWGDQSLKSLLDKYPQAVSISGHSHFSILDERSIYQDKFTAFTTQSIAYLEMERDKFDAFRAYDAETNAYSTLKGYISCPPDDTHVPMCLIMNVGQEKTEIERWNVLEKCEEKADSRWTLAYPLDLAHFTYRMNDRQIGRAAPVFPQGAAIAYEPRFRIGTRMERSNRSPVSHSPLRGMRIWCTAISCA